MSSFPQLHLIILLLSHSWTLLLFRWPDVKNIQRKTNNFIILNLNIIDNIINVFIFTPISELRLICAILLLLQKVDIIGTLYQAWMPTRNIIK